MNIEKIIAEYMANIAVIKQRIAELEQQKSKLGNCADRTELCQRITILNSMIESSNVAIYEMRKR